MRNVVIDTNVIISAALCPKGNPAKILALILENEDAHIYYSTNILHEYKDVLSRKRFNITIERQNSIITEILQCGILTIPTVSTLPLPDESDRIFYDTAKSINAILVTGNIKHFPNEPFIMTPSDFLKMIE